MRLSQTSREKRDLERAKLEERYAGKLAVIKSQILRAENKVEVQEAQYSQKKLETAMSIGGTLLGALFGRRTRRRASTAVSRMSRAAKERGDIGRAEEELELKRQKLADIEAELKEKLDALRDPVDPASFELDHMPQRPRKSDIAVSSLRLVWLPFKVGRSGIAEPAYDS